MQRRDVGRGAGPATGAAAAPSTSAGSVPSSAPTATWSRCSRSCASRRPGCRSSSRSCCHCRSPSASPDIDDFQQWTYVVTLLLTALTTGLLVAPAAIHRMLFGRGVKAATVRIGHHLFIAGLASLTLTLMGAVLLVLDVAVGRTFALWSAAAIGVVLIFLWFVLPLPVRAATTVRTTAPTATTRSR